MSSVCTRIRIVGEDGFGCEGIFYISVDTNLIKILLCIVESFCGTNVMVEYDSGSGMKIQKWSAILLMVTANESLKIDT